MNEKMKPYSSFLFIAILGELLLFCKGGAVRKWICAVFGASISPSVIGQNVKLSRLILCKKNVFCLTYLAFGRGQFLLFSPNSATPSGIQ